ncbi:amino acid permease [Virgisporangium aliadipatigenens]|uniref:Amino acid permease n=1 Tax=Virgisporangium aliadipatigenens TaxID=741659 RepID=A0A8J3YU47_9ACTN|nr:APC family permease [Virgisporangium aliadipatigenens]GIJ49793.1 amino acid permease [Virgisporangium aliadipatigenens]
MSSIAVAAARPDVVAQTLARNRLGVWAVVFFVMSAAAPFTVVAGVVTTGWAVTGIIALSVAFLVIGVVLALFSVGYVAMARRIEHTGAFYAYIARGLGRPAGVGAAWVALLSYNALQVGLYGAVGAAAAPVILLVTDVPVPWYLVAFLSWALVAVLGILQVDLNGKILAGLLVAEIAVICVFDVANLLHPFDRVMSFAALNPAAMADPGVGAMLVLAMLGFVGFESAVVYSEESRDPKRTVPVATYLTLGILSGLYAVSSWAITVVVGPANVVQAATDKEVGLIFELAATHLGGTVAAIGSVLFLTSVLAAMISFHNTTGRYIYALGREGVLPKLFGKVWQKTNAPISGSIAQSVLGLAVIITYAAMGWDPLVQLFFWCGTSGGVGVLLLITATSLAVISFFLRERDEENVWQWLFAPVLSCAALLVVSACAITNLDVLLDVSGPLRWTPAVAYGGLAVFGIVVGLAFKVWRPEVYERIGAGAKATLHSAGSAVASHRLVA